MHHPHSIDELILEQPDREHRLRLLQDLALYTPAHNLWVTALTDEEFADCVEEYAKGPYSDDSARYKRDR
jgi:hypothetical protein